MLHFLKITVQHSGNKSLPLESDNKQALTYIHNNAYL